MDWDEYQTQQKKRFKGAYSDYLGLFLLCLFVGVFFVLYLTGCL